MNKVKLYILPLFLLAGSLIAGIYTIKTVRSMTTMEAGTVSLSPDSLSGAPAQKKALSSEEMLTAKNIFSALAERNDLSMSASISTNKVIINAEKNSGVLHNYEGILSYLTGISDCHIPWSIRVFA
jgi:hypothetical protein